MYTKVIYLLYNGSHYDVFVKPKKDGDVGVFETRDKKTRDDAIAYANEINKLLRKTQSRIPKTRCNECQTVLISEDEVIEHSKITKHRNYEQIEN